MRFQYVLETENRNGLKERTVQDFDSETVLIGRGTNCDLQLRGRLVSLEHAKLEIQGDKLFVTDLSSISGVSVNNELVKREELKPRSRLKIGDYNFVVTKENGVWGLFEQRVAKDGDEDVETILERQERRLRLGTYLPSFTTLSVLLSVVVLVLVGALPVLGIYREAWDSGPISNPHKMIENDCNQCHRLPFVQVQDEQCLACHSMAEHAPQMPTLYQDHPAVANRCAQCHMEHNGTAGLIASESKLCTDCHAKLDLLLNSSETVLVSSLAKHPQFRVPIPERAPASDAAAGDAESHEQVAAVQRVSLDDTDRLKDPTTIKLNHKLHLEPDLAGADGLVTLACTDCHELSNDFATIKPINFERHCAECHPLDFDERLPGKAVPHGDSNVVYAFLYAQYAKLFLTQDGIPAAEEPSVRRKPGGQEVGRAPEAEFSRSAVQDEARAAEEALFTRTACHLCHEISEVDSTESDDPAGASKYSVVKPNIPADWMPAAVFDHGAHQEIACASCHNGATTSTETADVLLPGIQNCRQCHEQDSHRGKVVSDCVSCHSFHDPLLIDEEKRRDIERILLSIEPSRTPPSPDTKPAA